MRPQSWRSMWTVRKPTQHHWTNGRGGWHEDRGGCTLLCGGIPCKLRQPFYQVMDMFLAEISPPRLGSHGYHWHSRSWLRFNGQWLDDEMFIPRVTNGLVWPQTWLIMAHVRCVSTDTRKTSVLRLHPSNPFQQRGKFRHQMIKRWTWQYSREWIESFLLKW